MNPRRLMHVIGTFELATLILLLANLATIHHPAISSALGPIHGLAYTSTIIIAVLIMKGRHRIWLLSLVPGIGGLLAARATQSTDPVTEASAADGRSSG
ncbi:hypothetical protein GCM10029976_008120 [Kribbella albertanoniae]|uniref:DUF3817 domain-containing protein n=1 Tax=Kribbella albertanoniae TaxID=1266829 RepID=A0A4R4PX36_9ACTN|nr:hypothetical protein [Kribbella albertanoniae]TDC26903.1 hypothetical protein E1261_21720 [Kribbella albertanoniae]